MTITEQLQLKIDRKTKPLGALGTLEKLAFQIGKVQHTLTPVLTQPTLLVFAGDHGIAKSGVSAYPQEVTYQMVMNFLNGGAAINVFSRQNQISIRIIDSGVNFDFKSHELLINAKVAHGTLNFLESPAMTRHQLHVCFAEAAKIVDQVFEKNCNIIGFGEMGIGNTSSATMLMSYICKLPVEDCVGRGTGLNEKQLEAKIRLLRQAGDFHGTIDDPLTVLQTFGGFEIAQMCAAMLAAFDKNMLLMIDGFIAGSALLVASQLRPEILNNAIFCHLSEERGHQILLQYLNADPLLKLNMRLGEGTGCALAYPLINNAVAFLNQMASFESAGVNSTHHD